MSDKPLPFVITDRRKFTPEGESRPDADPSPEREPRPETLAPVQFPAPTPQVVPGAAPDAPASGEPDSPGSDERTTPAAPTHEQMEQSRLAFQATADRLDTAVRAANPGADHPPAMSFDQLVQSVYMQCVMQLGGGTPEGQQPQLDILGARQSIDMLGVLHDKTRGNLDPPEESLLLSALFELRLAFLEMTQALSRSAQQRAPEPPSTGGGPRIVR